MQDFAIKKKEALVAKLTELGSIAVAFSGGVDSTFLLAVSHEIMKEKVIAVTADSATHPAGEIGYANEFTHKKGIRHIIVQTEEMKSSAFVQNNPDRCYHCKRHMLEALSQIAHKEGINNIAHGANYDDMNDFRPGQKAADEAGVIAPLMDVHLGKKEIRFLSREMCLPTWNIPSMACLATRIPYGSRITEEKLKMIEEAEVFLMEQGLREIRVRHHGSVARIETGKNELDKFMDKGLRILIVNKFLKIGFAHVSLDLEGFISGKMNRAFKKED